MTDRGPLDSHLSPLDLLGATVHTRPRSHIRTHEQGDPKGTEVYAYNVSCDLVQSRVRSHGTINPVEIPGQTDLTRMNADEKVTLIIITRSDLSFNIPVRSLLSTSGSTYMLLGVPTMSCVHGLTLCEETSVLRPATVKRTPCTCALA